MENKTMNIALIGYGKMGKEIEKIALERGHSILQKLTHTPSSNDLKDIEVAIEFSRPESAFENISQCITQQVPVVSGTTGWLNKKQELEQLVQDKNGTFLYASNFSLGVNLFLEMTQKMAALMNTHKNYQIELEEIHHTEKLDAPSGTAISIAESIIAHSDYLDWTLDASTGDTHIPIYAKRIDQVPGTHTVKYFSEEDEIVLSHIAHSRRGFALGAVLAAEFIHDKKGIYTMKEVLGL